MKVLYILLSFIILTSWFYIGYTIGHNTKPTNFFWQPLPVPKMMPDKMTIPQERKGWSI